MTNVDRVGMGIVALAGVEERLESLLDRLRAAVGEHAGAAAAFQRFHATANEHRDRLAAHARQLGVERPSSDASTSSGETADGGDRGSSGACTGGISRALLQAYLAFNDATVGYSLLHETAHVLDSTRHGATLRLAERHLRDYAGAAQKVTQLLPEVVAWELRREGQDCACRCPSCELGICWCIAHTTDAIDRAWRETAPASSAAGLRVAPNGRRPDALDVRDGDVVVAVDGRRVATTADVMAAVLGHAPGEPITIAIERPGAVAVVEVVARRR